MAIDYYEILGVTFDAELDHIKRQYRTLVRENHPDVAADKDTAHARMLIILEAWNVLSDPRERARYDKTRGIRNDSPVEPEPTAQVPTAPVSEAVRRQRAAQNIRNTQPHARGGNPRTRFIGMVFNANLHFVEGRINEAIEEATRVTKADPTNAEAAALLGEIYAATERNDLAVLWYERAMRNQPGNTVYRHKWENLREKTKKDDPPPVVTQKPTTRAKPPIAPRAAPKPPPPTGPDIRDNSFIRNIRTSVHANLNAQNAPDETGAPAAAEAEAPAQANTPPAPAAPASATPRADEPAGGEERGSLVGKLSSWFKGSKK